MYRYVQAELVHARFAMTAVAGILIPGVSYTFRLTSYHYLLSLNQQNCTCIEVMLN